MNTKGGKKTKVLATGAFDLLHYGHLKFLEESKRIGGRNSKLVVIVARDSTTLRLKGKKPIMSEKERVKLVGNLKIVDEAFLGYKKFSIKKIIEQVKPDIISIGYDQNEVQKVVEKIIKENDLKIKTVRLRRFGKHGLYSSSKIKKRVIKNWGKL